MAHPGMITEEEVILAKKRSIYLEITARKGHSLTNGHVARLAHKVGASLVINTDAHDPSDLIDEEMAWKVGLGAGMGKKEVEAAFHNSQQLVEQCRMR